MNASIHDPGHPSIVYYDSDYPSRSYSRYPQNFDHMVSQQGIDEDVERYITLASEHGSKVLELCCGTGRVAIPLVMKGFNVTAIDVSTALLTRFKQKLKRIDNFPAEGLSIIKQDVTALSLTERNFDLVVCAFNSLLCIPDFDLQQETLIRAAAHLRDDGLLALDIWNPFAINLEGDNVPQSYFTRNREDNGNAYTRYAATGKMKVNQVQPVYGWYEERLQDGSLKRSDYAMEWRVIFRYEIQLMLERAGFEVLNIYGGNRREPLETSSLKMFIEAVKIHSK